MSPPPDIDALSPTELKSLVLQLFEEGAELRRTIAALRDEIARLKGGPGTPDIKANVKPSGMEKASEGQPSDPSGERRRRGGTRAKLTIDEERKLEVEAPPGSRFKGYASFLVQDLMIRPFVTDFHRERWQTPDGKTVTAPLPPGVDGHFGPELRRFVLAQYHQGQVTAARLVTLLRGFGIVISKRQVVRLLIAGKQSFLDEARGVLRAGLTNAAWITVDDTGARHKAKNGFCTQIGNAQFAWFGTTGSKSRLNFLDLLRAGHGDYVINDEALAYMRARALAGPVIARLSEHENRVFADRAAWNAHLERLGVAALKVHPDPVLIATEGASHGAASRRMACSPTPWSSATTPASSMSARMACAGFMPNDWSTNSTPSPTPNAPRRAASAPSSGRSTAVSKPGDAIHPRRARPPCRRGSIASSAAGPASPPSTVCSRA
jgi:hypothetical protein